MVIDSITKEQLHKFGIQLNETSEEPSTPAVTLVKELIEGHGYEFGDSDDVLKVPFMLIKKIPINESKSKIYVLSLVTLALESRFMEKLEGYWFMDSDRGKLPIVARKDLTALNTSKTYFNTLANNLQRVMEVKQKQLDGLLDGKSIRDFNVSYDFLMALRALATSDSIPERAEAETGFFSGDSITYSKTFNTLMGNKLMEVKPSSYKPEVLNETIELYL